MLQFRLKKFETNHNSSNMDFAKPSYYSSVQIWNTHMLCIINYTFKNPYSSYTFFREMKR